MDLTCRSERVQPAGITEYATSNKIPHVLKKFNIIISAVASWVRIKNMKYRMKIPTTITEAYEIDKENGNTVWRDAIKK